MNLRPEDLFEGVILKHYKGKLYRFIAFGKLTEDVTEVVIYQALYGDAGVWVRTKEEFFSDVEFEGGQIPRFSLADNDFYVIIDPEIVRAFEDNDLSLNEAIEGSNQEAKVGYTSMPGNNTEVKNKEITTMVIVGSAVGLSIIIKSLTSLIRTIQRKPKVITYDTLELIIEDGKILKDTSGVPIWKVKKEHEVIEFTDRPENTEMVFETKAKGFVLKYKNEN